MGRDREELCDDVRVEQQTRNPPSSDKVPWRAEGKPDIQETAQAQQEPDEEDYTQAAWPARQDTEGDTWDCEEPWECGELVDCQRKKRYRNHHKDVSPAEEPLSEQWQQGKHPQQDSESQQATFETDSEGQGNPIHLLRHPHGKRGAVGGQDRAKSAFSGCLTRKLAVNAELLWGNCILAIINRQKSGRNDQK